MLWDYVVSPVVNDFVVLWWFHELFAWLWRFKIVGFVGLGVVQLMVILL